MINLTIAGRVGQDAEINQVAGKTVINFSVAHSERWKDRVTGELKSKTVWVRCTRWTDQTGIVPYLKKGVAVVVTGSPHAGAYINNQGAAVGTLELNVSGIELMSKQENSESAPQQRSQASQPVNNGHPAGFEPVQNDQSASGTDNYDDLPF